MAHVTFNVKDRVKLLPAHWAVTNRRAQAGTVVTVVSKDGNVARTTPLPGFDAGLTLTDGVYEAGVALQNLGPAPKSKRTFYVNTLGRTVHKYPNQAGCVRTTIRAHTLKEAYQIMETEWKPCPPTSV